MDKTDYKALLYEKVQEEYYEFIAELKGKSVEEMPYFFVDTATKSGMLVSPVILYKDRPVAIFSEKEEKMSRHFTKFIGVYFGRIGADDREKGGAQLSRVWKSSAIQELIDNYKK